MSYLLPDAGPSEVAANPPAGPGREGEGHRPEPVRARPNRKVSPLQSRYKEVRAPPRASPVRQQVSRVGKGTLPGGDCLPKSADFEGRSAATGYLNVSCTTAKFCLRPEAPSQK